MRTMSHTAQQPLVFLIRHGETEWSKSGQHTGRTDIPLTEGGRRRATELGSQLNGRAFGLVLSSPLARAKDTCTLCGYGAQMAIDDDLLEWDYGVYEGRTTNDIRQEDPSWSVWLSPIAGGESLEQVGARARRLIERVTASCVNGDIALFAHGHILRVLGTAWVGLPPLAARYLALDTATISVLGYERQTRVIRQWNTGVSL